MASKIERAKRLLAGRGVARDDSDDELGTEELSWEWVYSPSIQTIIGARFGSFECYQGQSVLLKAEISKEAWVAIICEFAEEPDGEKVANFMWFATEKEIRNKKRRRHDAMRDELYITPSFDRNPLTTINGSARILGVYDFLKTFPSGQIPPRSKHCGKVFVCRRGCNTRTATFTPEFEWLHVYRGAEDIHALIEKVLSQTRATRKAKHSTLDERHRQIPAQSPPLQRKRKLNTDHDASAGKPRVKNPVAAMETREGRVNRKRGLQFTPLGKRQLIPNESGDSPYQVIRSRLHVSHVPTTFPCREKSFEVVFAHLEAAIAEGTGSCIYISGTPGTGKTATVREVITQMNAAVEADEVDDFIFVEINGMKVTDPYQAYSFLWEAIQGERVSPSNALSLLNSELGRPSPRRVPCVVLMDELDQLATKNQSVMYNFFNWPSLPHSRLIVLAVANTMDLPERTLSNKISSRLGLIRITFPGYTHEQLIKIIESRLEGLAGDIIEADAIQFASRKVAAVSGDARRALDICRRAVEIAEEGATWTGGSTRALSIEDFTRLPRVSIKTIKDAIKEATSSPLQQLVRNLPLSARGLLAAILRRATRNGGAPSQLAEVLAETHRQQRLLQHCTSMSDRTPQPPQKGKIGKGSTYELPVSERMALQSALASLVEAGIVEVDTKCQDRVGRVRLTVGTDDVNIALRNDDEVQSRGIAF